MPTALVTGTSSGIGLPEGTAAAVAFAGLSLADLDASRVLNRTSGWLGAP